jgi:cation:H+ antiporter
MTIFISIFLGLLALYFGAELLVRYSAHLAASLGVSSLIIGLTVVAYGTSSPELIVNILASLFGDTDIALGNIVGSNIFNVLVILGLSAIVCPLVVHQQIILWDVPIMILASMMVWVAASTGNVNFWTGIVFLALIILYTIGLIYKAQTKEDKSEFDVYTVKERLSWKIIAKDVGMIVLSLVILVIGSQLLVKGAVALAQLLGVSELIISLTIVAAGTSIPELATSVVAAMRGQRDIAVGNVVGSNIYNIWAILGLSAILAPHGLPVPESAWTFDIPVMVAVAIACLPIFLTGHTIYRWEGALFLGCYLAYLTHLVLSATSHPWLRSFQEAMIFFFIPLIALTLLIGVIRHLRSPQ